MTPLACFDAPHRALRLANQLLASGMLMLLLGILLAYVYDAGLSLPVLLLAHLFTVLGPTLVKLGYVLRLHAQRRLEAPPAPSR